MGRLVKLLVTLAIVAVLLVVGHEALVAGARGAAGGGIAGIARDSCGACHAR